MDIFCCFDRRGRVETIGKRAESMQEQPYTQKTINADGTLYPAEGRVDVAEGVEEEQRNAYSAHHPSQEGGTQKRQAVGRVVLLSRE